MAETLSLQSSLSYRNQSIDLQSKTLDWFLYDRDLRHERVNMKESRTTPSTISNFLIVNFKQIQVIKGFLYFSYKLRRLGKRKHFDSNSNYIDMRPNLNWGWSEVKDISLIIYLFSCSSLREKFDMKVISPWFSIQSIM